MDTYPQEVEQLEPVYKTVKIGSKRVTLWVTSDGEHHSTKAKADNHQKKLDAQTRRQEVWDSIKQKEFTEIDILNLPTFFYFAETEEQLGLITEQMRLDTHSYHYINGDVRHDADALKVGDWIGHVFRDGGDYRDEYSWYTLKFVVGKLAEFLDEAREG